MIFILLTININKFKITYVEICCGECLTFSSVEGFAKIMENIDMYRIVSTCDDNVCFSSLMQNIIGVPQFNTYVLRLEAKLGHSVWSQVDYDNRGYFCFWKVYLKKYIMRVLLLLTVSYDDRNSPKWKYETSLHQVYNLSTYLFILLNICKANILCFTWITNVLNWKMSGHSVRWIKL